MALVYSPNSKQWNFTPEKTDNPTDLNVVASLYGYPGLLPETEWNYSIDSGDSISQFTEQQITDPKFQKQLVGYNNQPLWDPVNKQLTAITPQGYRFLVPINVQGEPNQNNININNFIRQTAEENAATNKKNAAKNQLHQTVINQVNNTKAGNKYLPAKETIEKEKANLIKAGFKEAEAQSLIDGFTSKEGGVFRSYYAFERTKPIDFTAAIQNLDIAKQRNDVISGFDGSYYAANAGKDAAAMWTNAVQKDDLDIIQPYSNNINAYLRQDYVNKLTDPANVGRLKDIRGSAPKPISPLVSEYEEKAYPGTTTAEQQLLRDKVQKDMLGLQAAPSEPGGYSLKQDLSDLLSKEGPAKNLWQQAQADLKLPAPNTPWKNILESLNVNSTFITDQSLFALLLGRLAVLDSSNAEDKAIINANASIINNVKKLKTDNAEFGDLVSYSPEINQAFTAAVQDAEKVQVQRFGELRQDILKETINALVQAKRQETNLSFLKSSSVGKELSSMQEEINNSFLGDLNIGGMMPGTTSTADMKSKLDFGLSDVFGTKNGLIYNWEDWFNKQIEKKYAGDIDIPDDYVPPTLRTAQNGFVLPETVASWKKYDNAYAALKINPNDQFAKTVISSAPADYVRVEDRKAVKKEWEDYEATLKQRGYVDPETANKWASKGGYDAQYRSTKTISQEMQEAGYIPPDQRMDAFARDFFSYYLKPRFDASQSIAEFQDYIDVNSKTQNPFQTQDKLNALKLAAESNITKYFADLNKASSSKFNSEYYFDPKTYLQTKGISDLLPSLGPDVFKDLPSAIADGYNKQTTKVNNDWEAAKRGETTLGNDGKPINWAQEAYRYGYDLNNKDQFAQLHYQFFGQHVKDASGAPAPFDAAPDIYAPLVTKTYITKVLTPYLIDTSNKIGTVFGKFVKPENYVDELLNAFNVSEYKSQWNNILKNYGLDPNASRDEIKNYIVDALKQSSTTDINTKIKDFLTENQDKLPTQADLGVEYIQRDKVSATAEEPTGVYAVFKNAGFKGTEQEFYSTYMPDASKEDISLVNAAFTSKGKPTPLLPTVTGTGMEKISTMAQLFGDTSISEVLGTAGIAPTTQKPSLFAQLITPQEGEEVGIGDPFSDAATPFATSSGTTSKDQIGITNPFDDIGINDPFNDPSDPFGSIKSSVTSPTIKTSNLFGVPSLASKRSMGFSSDLFESFGGSFGF